MSNIDQAECKERKTQHPLQATATGGELALRQKSLRCGQIKKERHEIQRDSQPAAHGAHHRPTAIKIHRSDCSAVQPHFDFEIKLCARTAADRATMSAPLSSSDIENVQADKLKAVVDLDRALEQLFGRAKNLLQTVAQAEQGLVSVRLCQVILIERDKRNRPKRCTPLPLFCWGFASLISHCAAHPRLFHLTLHDPFNWCC
jgi:hypothetical protein